MRLRSVCFSMLFLGLTPAGRAAESAASGTSGLVGETTTAMPAEWGPVVAVSEGVWGRMVETTHDTWLCVSTRFRRGTNSLLQIRQSTNDCRGWDRVAEVAEPGRTLDNGELARLPNGDLLLTGRSLINGQSYRLPVYRSRDGGLSWRYLSNLDSSEGRGERGLWEPDFWVLADGRLTATYSNEKHAGFSQLISERVSTNGGVTWGGEIRVVAQPGGGELRPGMSQMARLADGRYILVYEVVGRGNGDVHFKLSADGVNWPEGLGTAIPGQHCGPFVAVLGDGRIVVISCANVLAASADAGATWLPLEPPAWQLGFKFTWPALYPLGTNQLAVMISDRGIKLRRGRLVLR